MYQYDQRQSVRKDPRSARLREVSDLLTTSGEEDPEDPNSCAAQRTASIESDTYEFGYEFVRVKKARGALAAGATARAARKAAHPGRCGRGL